MRRVGTWEVGSDYCSICELFYDIMDSKLCSNGRINIHVQRLCFFCLNCMKMYKLTTKQQN